MALPAFWGGDGGLWELWVKPSKGSRADAWWGLRGKAARQRFWGEDTRSRTIFLQWWLRSRLQFWTYFKCHAFCVTKSQQKGNGGCPVQPQPLNIWPDFFLSKKRCFSASYNWRLHPGQYPSSKIPVLKPIRDSTGNNTCNDNNENNELWGAVSMVNVSHDRVNQWAVLIMRHIGT